MTTSTNIKTEPSLATASQKFTTAQAAAYLGVTPGTLTVWRCTRRYKIPFLKIGRLVRYRREDLDAWLERRLVCFRSPEDELAGVSQA